MLDIDLKEARGFYPEDIEAIQKAAKIVSEAAASAEEGTFIPLQYIKDNELCVTEGLVLSIIDYWCFKFKFFGKSSSWIAEKLNISRVRATQIIGELNKKGYINVVYSESNNARTVTRTNKNERPRFKQNFNTSNGTSEQTPSQGGVSTLTGGCKAPYTPSNIRVKERKELTKVSSSVHKSERIKTKLVLRGETKNNLVHNKSQTLRDKIKEEKLLQDTEENIHVPKDVRYMIAYWNEQSDKNKNKPKKVLEFFNGKQSKTFKTLVKTCKDFLSGRLYDPEKGNGIVPSTFENKSEEINRPFTYKEFTKFVDRFVVVLTDKNYQPYSKAFLRDNCTLSTFLAGNGFSKSPSLLLAFCMKDPEPVFQFKYKEFHKCLELAWKEYRPEDKLNGKDHQNFDKLCRWLIPMIKNDLGVQSPILIKNAISSRFMESLEHTWKNKKVDTSYLPSKHCREGFISYLDKLNG